MEMKRITKLILLMDNIDLIVDTIRSSIQSFHDNHQSSIINYDNWKVNCQKEEYLKDPQFKIYEIKNRNSPNVLVAKVKWIFLFDGKMLGDKFTVVYLGSVSKYPLLKEDKQLQRDVKDIIKCYFNEKSPNLQVNGFDLNKMKDEVELYYYWKEKLNELEYRLDPKFYISKSSNDKQDQIILNIKWGFEVIGKSNKPRYILKRYTTKNNFQDNFEDKSVKDELEQVVKNHINKVSPVFFAPPIQ
jgi:hypothetical protein